MKKFISWRRVSTQKQSRSGLGIAAQKDIIDYFVKAEEGLLVADYEEAYTGTDLEGCKELQKAMAHCKEVGATLIIAKTDRFRSTIEALQIYDEMRGNIYFCDLPHTDKFTLTLFFALAEREALLVSIRTKQALNVIKEKIARGEAHISKQGNITTHLGSQKGCKGNQKSIDAMKKRNQEKAKANKNNISFYRYMKLYEKRNGAINRSNVEDFVNELNTLQLKTATGLDYDVTRTFSMLYKVKKMYAE